VGHTIAIPGPQVSHTPSQNKAEIFEEKNTQNAKTGESDRGRCLPLFALSPCLVEAVKNFAKIFFAF